MPHCALCSLWLLALLSSIARHRSLFIVSNQDRTSIFTRLCPRPFLRPPFFYSSTRDGCCSLLTPCSSIPAWRMPSRSCHYYSSHFPPQLFRLRRMLIGISNLIRQCCPFSWIETNLHNPNHHRWFKWLAKRLASGFLHHRLTVRLLSANHTIQYSCLHIAPIWPSRRAVINIILRGRWSVAHRLPLWNM